MRLTPEQEAIIAADCQNILVSAAAGSGKTAVLTDRIVGRIVRGDLDIQRVLVVTFTEAAARNMREKIEDKLRRTLADESDPDRRRLIARQISWLPAAAISTIHAFCLSVIRDFYYCARDERGKPLIEPGFAVDDGVESDQLLRQTLDSLMNKQYDAVDQAGENPDPTTAARIQAFYRLMEGYGDNSGDLPVRELIINLHHFLRSLPDYGLFVADRLQELQTAAEDFAASPHCRTLVRQLRLRLDRALDRLPELENLLNDGIRFIAAADRNQAYNRMFRAVFAVLHQLDRYLADNGSDWDEIRRLTGGLAGLELPRASRGDTPEKTRFLDLFRDAVAEVVHFLAGSCGAEQFRSHFIFPTAWIFGRPAADIEADVTVMLPSIRLLFDWVLELDRLYAAEKRAAGLIDFSDFEHFALAILRQDEARTYYRSRFQEIYIDEYQDTSSIQEAILLAISQDNCLMVGDIKQSIYRFRHARPLIFRQKAADYQTGRQGRLFELNRNFRSVSGILTAVNELFSQLMSVGAGEIDYDRRQALVPFRDNMPEEPAPVQLLLLDRMAVDPQADGIADPTEPADLTDPAGAVAGSDGPDPFGDLARNQMEALMVLGQIRQLRSQGQALRDMVILSRTRAVGQIYREQLETAGIPILADSGSFFLDAPVIRLMEALIHVLDNQLQDIPLAAVMHGNIFEQGFSLDDLARIRLFGRQQEPEQRFFHQAALLYRETGPDPDLRLRLQVFNDWLARLRIHEQSLRLGELVGMIYAETRWLDRVAAGPDGLAQVRLLRSFQQWVEQFERGRRRGLYQLARSLESLRRRGPLESPAAPGAAGEEAVRIMTIHGSKGLEFPIVFLVGLGGRLRAVDSQDHLLLSESLGIGLDFADPERQIRYQTHLKLAMLEELKAAGLAEELRLLYVAMTRAMNRLYLAGTVHIKPDAGDKRLLDLLEQARRYPVGPLPDYLVLSCRTYLEWIMLTLARNPAVDLSFLEGAGAAPARMPEPTDRLLSADRATEKTCWPIRLGTPRSIRQELAVGLPTPVQEMPEAGPDGEPVEPAAVRQDDERDEAIRLRVLGPYRFEQAARTPVKLTVSELKRREQIMIDPEAGREVVWESGQPPQSLAPRGVDLTLRGLDFDEDWAAIGPANRMLAGARQGTILHAVFRYLDLTAARAKPDLAEINRQVSTMAGSGMIAPAELDVVRPHYPDILAFVRSDLAGELVRALAAPGGAVYYEMPFTLALPACQIYQPCRGLDPEDRVLVQGIIDCWYQMDGQITLIDYKTDRIAGDDQACELELRYRYGRQLAYYAQAVEAAAGKPVARRLVWHIRRARAFLFD